MEVAGWQVARFVDQFLNGIGGKRVVVVAGSGNNGGDALVAARMLWQRGARVSCSVVAARDPGSLVSRHTRTIRELGIRVDPAPAGIGPSADVIIDGLLGTGIRPPLRAPAPEVIAAMNGAGSPIVAVDVPSGIDADSGAGGEDAVRAVATVTLAVPKPALSQTRDAGRVFVADIGMPAALFSANKEEIEKLYRIGDLVELVHS
jgi:NAD(P)H-hydrate epimerase